MKVQRPRTTSTPAVKGLSPVEVKQTEAVVATAVTPETTRVPLPDPHVRGTMPAKSSWLQARLDQKTSWPSASELAARVRDDNFEYHQPVLDVLHFMDDAGKARLRMERFSGSLISRMSFSEIEQLDANPAWAQKLLAGFQKIAGEDERFQRRFANAIGRTPSADDLRLAANLILAYRLIRSIPERSHYTNEELGSLAALERRELRDVAQVFRFDSRAPDEIKREGFLPNPTKPRGTLYEHSRPGVGSHGGGFVSLSTQPGNEFNLAIGPVLMSSTPMNLDEPGNAAMLQELTSTPASKGTLSLLATWEYEVVDVRGAQPPAGHGIAGEAEIVTNAVPAENVVRARRVWIAADVERDRFGEISNFQVLGSRIDAWTDLSATR